MEGFLYVVLRRLINFSRCSESNYIREKACVASGYGVSEGDIPACDWDDREKQRKTSV
jgi:ribosomal protein L37E